MNYRDLKSQFAPALVAGAFLLPSILEHPTI